MTRTISRPWFALYVALAVAACGGGGGGGDSGSIPNPVTTPAPVTVDNLNFSHQDFSEVEILNSFAFIVQYGDQFGVQVEVDSQYSHLVKVTQDGVRLRIQFDPDFQGNIEAQVARGIVTLPVLETLETNGSAFVDLAGFTQSFLQVRQKGSSHIEGSNSRIDFVDVSLNGSSHLSLLNFAPVPAINVHTTGSSQARLSIMDGGTLTGTAAGSSNVGFYGSNLSVQTNAVNTATFTWLGPTAP